MLKMSIEAITPAAAMEMLKKSGGNRAMKSDHIASLAAQMRRGEWMENGSSIVFDTGDKLIDGHHRLMAIHISESTQKMIVVRGAQPGAMFTIDTGKARTLADHLTLYGGTNTGQRSSYLCASIRVLTGCSVPIKTVEAYNAWEPIVHEGTEAFFKLSLNNKPHLRGAGVAAPLILAYKMEPDVMSAFFVAIRDGEGMKSGTAAHTLREFLTSLTSTERRSKRDGAEMLASKVFAAVQAHIAGRPLKKLQASAEALDWFRKLYARGAAGKLIAEAKVTRNNARKLTTSFTPGAVAA